MGLETPYVAVGLPPGADRGRERRPSADADGRDVGHLRLPRRLPRPPQAARAGARGVRRRPTTRACGWSSRRRSSASRCAPPRTRRERDPRIELRLADEPTAEHLRAIASCDVCLAPVALGGPGAAAVRGDRLRTAGDHQRRAADERGDPRRLSTALLVPSTPNGTARSGIPALDPDVGDLRRGDRAARRRLGCAPSSPRARCGCATPSAAGTTPLPGIGELLTTTAKG